MTLDEPERGLLEGDRDLVDEDHIDAFENALLWEHEGSYLNSLSTTSSLLPTQLEKSMMGPKLKKSLWKVIGTLSVDILG